MSSMRERIRLPQSRLLRDAGPPWKDNAVAGIGAAIILAALAVIGLPLGWPWWTYALVPVVAFTVVGLVDRAGWRIRTMAYGLAIHQRQRWRHGPLPVTSSDAAAWLDSPSMQTANDLERASILVTAGRDADAAALVDGFAVRTDGERASVARLRAFIEARRTGQMDLEPVLAAAAILPPDERRYQVTAASFARALFDLQAKRPWRQRLVEGLTGLEPYPIPVGLRLLVAIQQLALPIAVGVAALVTFVVFPG